MTKLLVGCGLSRHSSSPGASLNESATPTPTVSSCPDATTLSLRENVLAGPRVGMVVSGGADGNPLSVVATPAKVAAALAAAGFTDKCRGLLTGGVTTVLVVGLCLYCGQGYPDVIARLWPLLGAFNPALVLSSPVTPVALSQARGRLPARVLQRLFEAGAGVGDLAQVTGALLFGAGGDRGRRHGVRPGRHRSDPGTVRHSLGGPVPPGPGGHPGGVRDPPGAGRGPGLLRGQRAGPVGPPGHPVTTGHPEPGRSKLLLDAPLADRGRHRRAPGLASEERHRLATRHRPEQAAGQLPAGAATRIRRDARPPPQDHR